MKQLVIVIQPNCSSLFLVAGHVKDTFVTSDIPDRQLLYKAGSYTECAIFARGYALGTGDYEFARLAFARSSGDAQFVPWEFPGTRERIGGEL